MTRGILWLNKPHSKPEPSRIGVPGGAGRPMSSCYVLSSSSGWLTNIQLASASR